MKAIAGFFGKIPARGDFVRHGLPSDLVQDLDDWWQVVLPGSQARLGDTWVASWMEAPIWRFMLPPGLCGGGVVAGLWLPSTDKAGRLFPLTLAITARDWRDLADQGGFLDAAEAIGIDAVEQDVSPDQLAIAIAQAADAKSGSPLPPVDRPTWWSAGSRLVAPVERTYAGMPDAAGFAAMLSDEPPPNGILAAC